MNKNKNIPDTAYWFASVRSRSPLVKDEFAERFLRNHQSELARFSHLKRPAISVAVRHRAIDEHLTVQLGLDPGTQIILVAAGFDTRAYRLHGGIWYELDATELIAEKEDTLPSRQARNTLTRIGVNFKRQDYAGVLSSLVLRSGSPVIVVLEGVINHLRKKEILAILNAVSDRYPGAIFIMDIMSSAFLNRHATDVRDTVSSLGAPFQFLLGDPKTFFTEHGYRVIRQMSILEKGEEYGERKFPGWIKKLFLQSLVTGYCIYFVRKTEPEQ